MSDSCVPLGERKPRFRLTIPGKAPWICSELTRCSLTSGRLLFVGLLVSNPSATESVWLGWRFRGSKFIPPFQRYLEHLVNIPMKKPKGCFKSKISLCRQLLGKLNFVCFSSYIFLLKYSLKRSIFNFHFFSYQGFIFFSCLYRQFKRIKQKQLLHHQGQQRVGWVRC